LWTSEKPLQAPNKIKIKNNPQISREPVYIDNIICVSMLSYIILLHILYYNIYKIMWCVIICTYVHNNNNNNIILARRASRGAWQGASRKVNNIYYGVYTHSYYYLFGGEFVGNARDGKNGIFFFYRTVDWWNTFRKSFSLRHPVKYIYIYVHAHYTQCARYIGTHNIIYRIVKHTRRTLFFFFCRYEWVCALWRCYGMRVHA